MRTRQKRREQLKIASKYNRVRSQRLIEAIEPRILMSGYALSDVASFSISGGHGPTAGLVMDSSGDLFGTTRYGGTSNNGTIFEITPGSNALTTLASFSSSTGYGVIGSLAIDSSGNLYGNTQYSGGGNGTIFKYSASSGTLSVLASFSSGTGYTPTTGLVWDSNGNLIGANRYGASGLGAIFEYNTSNSTLSVLDSFSTSAFGVTALVVNPSNQIFGATTYGNSGNGTLIEANESGSGISIIANFSSSTGYTPGASLTIDSQGNLFGTAHYGGSNSDGTVFGYNSSSGLTAIASLSSSTGYYPMGGVVEDSSGNLFGTASYGGSNSDGTLFEIAAGSSSITVQGAFSNSLGYTPEGGLIANSNGDLFGVLGYGASGTDGAVYELAPLASQAVITSQPTSVILGTPQSVTVSLENSSGLLANTNRATVTLSIASGPTGATIGGTTSMAAVNGVATFSGLTFSKPGAYTLTAASTGLTPATSNSFGIVQNYSQVNLANLSSSLGSQPQEMVMDSTGNIYGVTNQGGDNDRGAVYKIAAGTHAVTLLASFGSPDWNTGAYPQSGLTIDSAGNLWGTTSQGGTNSAGVIYEITANSITSGNPSITTAASLPTINGGISAVDDNMAIDSNGNLYGASQQDGNGYVFELPANDRSNVTTLYTFTGGSDGANPVGSVIVGSNGILYGTTTAGGTGDGTVYQISNGTLSTLATFNGSGNGSVPYGTPVMDANGDLFGTTTGGGTNSDGTIWEIPATTGTLVTLASFNGTNGSDPQRGQLILDSTGDLFGTTYSGGTGADGTAWELPAGTGTIFTLTNFNNPTVGYNPTVGLVMDSAGNLFGTTSSSAGASDGSIFELTPSATQVVITSQPTTTVITDAPQSITVNLEDAGGQTDVSNNSTVTLSIANGGGPAGATLGGTTTVTAVNGVATFSGVTFSTVGTYTLTATSSGLTSGTSSSIVFSPPTDVWNGNNTNYSWEVASNWQGGYAPVKGQSVDFPASQSLTQFGIHSSEVVGNITMEGNYTIFNYALADILTVEGNITFTNGTNDGQPDFDMALNLAQSTTITVGASDSASMWGFNSAANGVSVTKEGAGTLSFSGSNPASTFAGPIEVAQGTFMGGEALQSSVTVDSGATFDPPGSVGGITANSGGTVNLGSANSSNVSFASGSNVVESIGAFQSTEYDGELIATGSSISLGGADLSLSLQNGFTPAIGHPITLISNQTGSAVTGTFSGLAEGTIFRSGNSFFQISYAGGSSGQDVTLTVVAAPVDVWTGANSDGQWSMANNWSYGVPIADQSVDFPDLGGTTLNQVDLSGNVTVGNITMEGNYGLEDYNITLDGNITASNTDDAFGSTTTLTHNTTLNVGVGDWIVYANVLDDYGNHYGVTITGGGSVQFKDQCAYGGVNEVQNGTLDNEGELHSAVVVDPDGTVVGEGVFDAGIVGNGGTISVGNSDFAYPLTVPGATFSNGTTLQEELTTDGSTETDGELIVNSTPVNLTGGVLALSTQNGFTPAVGDVITLISNQTGSAVTGTFNGLAEGTVFQSGGSWFKISYAGGSSQQDVTLTVTTAPATQAVFTAQPTHIIAGAAQAITVSLESGGGVVDTNYTSNVILTIDSGPNGASIGGTLTEQAVAGVASFSGLTFDIAGTYTLTAAANGLTSATSGTITVSAAAASKLEIALQPTNAVEGAGIGNVVVDVEDTYDNLVITDNSTVTMTTTDGTPVGGTPSADAISGVATFSNLTITRPGSHALLASDGNLTPATSSLFPVAPSLTTLTITAPANSVTVGQTLQFTASGTDGAGSPITLDPVTWSLDGGSAGSIDQNGLFNAGSITSSGGTATVIATCDGQTAAMTITVNPIPPVIRVNAYAQMVSSTSNTGTLHVEAAQNGTDANLIYTWSILSQPTNVSSGLNVGAEPGSPAPLALFAINGTNTAKNTPVTFLASGNYVLQVVASNGVQSVTSEVQVTAKVNPKVTPEVLAQSTTVSGVQPVSTGQSITGFVVTFNGPVDPTTAQNVLGYRIFREYTVNQSRSFWQQLFGQSADTQTEQAAYPIASAVYNPQTLGVTLTLATPMPMQNGTRLVQVLGTGKHAVLDANGKAIDGDSNGKAGGNFTYRFNMSVGKTINYQTTAGDKVTLSLSGPGKIAAIVPSGTATPVIDLLDTDSTYSILTGKLRKSKKSPGYAVLDQINGTTDADVQLGDKFHVNQAD